MSLEEILFFLFIIVFISVLLIGVIASIPSLMWIRKMRETIEKLDQKYKEKLTYQLKTGTNEIVDLSTGSLSTYLSGTYFSAIIFIGLLSVLIFYYVGLVFQSSFDFKEALNKFSTSLNKQFEKLSDIFDNPTDTTVIFAFALCVFVISFFTYVGLFVVMTNALKTILKNKEIKTFYDNIKADKIKDIDEKNSKIFVEIYDLIQKTLDSSSTAISAFGIAAILFAILLIVGGVSSGI